MLHIVDHIGQQGIFGGSLNGSARAGGGQQRQHLRRGKFRWPALQRFVYKGMGAPTGKTIPPPKP